jgi:hypothetical protein
MSNPNESPSNPDYALASRHQTLDVTSQPVEDYPATVSVATLEESGIPQLEPGSRSAAPRKFNRWWLFWLGGGALLAVLLLALTYLGWTQFRQFQVQQLALKDLRNLKAQAQNEKCITQAQAFPGPNLSEFYRSAQDILGECQLAQAQTLAQRSQLTQAIQLVSKVNADVPSYGQAQRLIVEWSDQILAIAQRKYLAAKNQKGFQDAIKIAQAVPPGNAIHDRAQAILKEWAQTEKDNKVIFEQAQKLLKEKRWGEAKELGNQLLASPVEVWQKSARLVLAAAAKGETPLDLQGQITGSSPTLEDKTPYEEHTFAGTRGQIVIITLESADFEPRLILIGPDDKELSRNSNSFVGTNDALIGAALPETGTYKVIVNATEKSGLGQYRLLAKTR